MENIVIKFNVLILCIITKRATKNAINPAFTPAKHLYFAGKRRIMAIMSAFGGEINP